MQFLPAAKHIVRQIVHLGVGEPIGVLIFPAQRQRRPGEIDVDHRAGTAGQRRHGKRAGETEQVEHPLAFGALPQPGPPRCHIREKTQILAALEIEPVAQAALLRPGGLRQSAAPHLGDRRPAVAVLEHQGVAPQPRQRLAEALFQRRQRGRIVVVEQGRHQHRREPVQGEPFPAGQRLATAVKKAVASVARGNQKGAEQVYRIGGRHAHQGPMETGEYRRRGA